MGFLKGSVKHTSKRAYSQQREKKYDWCFFFNPNNQRLHFCYLTNHTLLFQDIDYREEITALQINR